MSEVSEQPIPQETKKESVVVKKVREAVQRVSKEFQKNQKEYAEIRHAIQGDPLTTKGIYEQHIKNIDTLGTLIYGSSEQKFGKFGKILETSRKIEAKLESAVLAGGSTAADVVYNAATWPIRQFRHIPKDIFKRSVAVQNEFHARKITSLSEEQRKSLDISEIVKKIKNPRPPMPAKV